MNDNTIISAISAIHRAMVSFFIFILVLCSLIYMTLKDGYLLEHLDLPNLNIEQLYIKWDEKLSIHVKRLYISLKEEQNPTSFELTEETYLKLFRSFTFGQSIINAIHIETLRIGNTTGSVHLRSDQEGDFHFVAPTRSIQGTVTCTPQHLLLNIDAYQDQQYDLNATAIFVADLQAHHFYATVAPRFQKTDHLQAYLFADADSLDFALDSKAPLTHVKPIVDLFDLPWETAQWIVDKPKGEGLTLHQLYGSLPYQNPEAVLQTLYAKASFEHLSYRFNNRLEPLYSSRTDLELSKGVLNIYPQDGSFYGQSTGNSWLNIDFNTPKTLLNAFIVGDLTLNDDIVHMLQVYRVNLPFKQTQGITTTDLDLHIELIGGRTQAEGTFYIPDGQVNYKGLELDVTEANITLSNTDVTISKLHIRYGSRFDIDIDGHFNPVADYGHINLALNHARLGSRKKNVQLSQQGPLNVDYVITEAQDTIILEPSSWQFQNQSIQLDAATIPFDFASSVGTLQEVGFHVEEMAKATISGKVDLVHKQIDVHVDLKELLTPGVRNLTPVSLGLQYQEHLDINLSQPSQWEIEGTQLTFSPIHMEANTTHTRLTPLEVQVNDEANATAHFILDHDTMSADVTIDALQYLHHGLGLHYQAPAPLKALAHLQKDAFYFASDAPDIAFNLTPDRWDFFLFSFEKLAPDAPLLERFSLTDGYLQIGRERGQKALIFAGNLTLPYAILVHDNTPTHQYEILGTYENNMTRLRVNDALDVVINDAVHITTHETGVHILELIHYINDRPPSTDVNASFPLTTLYATDGYIYMTPSRKALFDELSVTVDQQTIYGRMSHKKGIAVLEMEGREFALYGTGFGDRFMRHLLSLADYQEGELSFHLDGLPDDARGVMHIKKTIVKDYKALNNILAFINTVPALATFSLPNYSDRGLEIDTAYANFHYNGEIVTVEGVRVDSDEIDITGNGIIDYTKEQIDLKLNLITDAGENVSKIPLLGYILVGDRGDVTATLRIKGALDDPKVSNDIAENIVVAPFKMLWRTIELPFKLFESDTKPKK